MHYLIENQKIPLDLEDTIKQTPSLHPYFEINFNGIKPKNYCGFLSIHGQSYFISPKISTSNTQNHNTFIYMLLYAYDIKLKNEDFMQGEREVHSIFEIFIRLFSDRLLAELKKGVFKQYITLQENIKVLKGKYIIEKNFSNFYHQNLYCEFDEFSMDNELNRFLLYALRYLKKFSTYANLYKCEAILDEVRTMPIDIQTLHIPFDRMNRRYEHSYEIALMILQKLVPMTNKSNEKSFAFLFDMAVVFEKFVGKLYQGLDPSTVLQKRGVFGSLVLKPDIFTKSLIIDTKYKKISTRGDLSVQDKYQMFVYGVNFGVKDTMLLYPKYTEEINDNLELGKGEDLIRLNLRSLDLNFDAGYSAFICEIEKRLEGLDDRN